MKRFLFVVLVLIGGIGSANAQVGEVPEPRPLVIEFVSRVAGHPKMIDRTLYSDPMITTMLAKRSGAPISFGTKKQKYPTPGVMRVAIEDEPELAEKWEVSGLPTFILFDANGEEVSRTEGMLETGEYLDFLRRSTMFQPAPASVTDVPMAASATPTVAVDNLVTIPWTEASSSTYTTPPATTVSTTQSVPGVMVFGDTTFMGELSDRTELFYPREFTVNTLWTITLSAVPDDVDVDISVSNASGEVIALSEGPSGSEELSLAVSPGRYILRVFLYRAIAAPLTFKITEKMVAVPEVRILPMHSAPQLLLDQSRSAIPGAGGENWFSFIAMKPGRYRFTLSGAVTDATAVSSSGEIIGTFSRGEVMAALPSMGRIFLRVKSTGNDPITVMVSEGPAIVDPQASQVMLEPNRQITGTVGGGVLERLYRVTTPGAWKLVLKGTDAARVDIDLEILTPDGQLVARAEGPTGEETLMHEHEPGEVHVVRVYAYRAPQPVNFTLEMVPGERTPSPDQPTTPAIEVPASAERLENDVVREHAVGPGATQWYTIRARREGLYGVFLNGADEDVDIDLAIHRPAGEPISISQNEHAREAILLWLEADETVFLRVFSYRDSPGSSYDVWYESLGR